jgi:hypothetical protein
MINETIDRLGITRNGFLVERATGKQACYEARPVPGKAWTVMLAIGGESSESEKEYINLGHRENYTKEEAETAAHNLQHNTREVLKLVHSLVS